MKPFQSRILSSALTLSLAALLTACGTASESAKPRGVSDSPWARRTAATDTVAAPAADTYKQDLVAIDTGTDSSVNMGYQTEQVNSVVPDPMMEPMPAEPAPEVMAPAIIDEPAPVASTGMAGSDDDIRNVPASYFTVQLIASVKESDVRAYAGKHQLGSSKVVPTVRSGTTWYVLLLDVYPNKAAAKAAADEVAASLPTKPWVRTVGSVQQLMP